MVMLDLSNKLLLILYVIILKKYNTKGDISSDNWNY